MVPIIIYHGIVWTTRRIVRYRDTSKQNNTTQQWVRILWHNIPLSNKAYVPLWQQSINETICTPAGHPLTKISYKSSSRIIPADAKSRGHNASSYPSASSPWSSSRSLVPCPIFVTETADVSIMWVNNYNIFSFSKVIYNHSCIFSYRNNAKRWNHPLPPH